MENTKLDTVVQSVSRVTFHDVHFSCSLENKIYILTAR
jgi:hypothetical protein